MPISGKDWVKMTDEDMVNLFKPTKCMTCGVTLHESTTGCRLVEGGCQCSDCYFKDFSEELDHHPIGIPRMHRGA